MTGAKKIENNEEQKNKPTLGLAPLAQKSHSDYGLALLSLPIVGTLLAIFWVGEMALIQDPSSKLSLLTIAVVVGTAIFANMEAGQFDYESHRVKGIYSPTQWFMLISLMWIIGYPAYLLRRKHFGLNNLVISGTLVMAIYSLVALILFSAIEDKKAEIRNSLNKMQNDLRNIQEQFESNQ